MAPVERSGCSTLCYHLNRHVDKALAVTALVLAIIGILALESPYFAAVKSYWYTFEIAAVAILALAAAIYVRRCRQASPQEITEEKTVKAAVTEFTKEKKLHNAQLIEKAGNRDDACSIYLSMIEDPEPFGSRARLALAHSYLSLPPGTKDRASKRESAIAFLKPIAMNCDFEACLLLALEELNESNTMIAINWLIRADRARNKGEYDKGTKYWENRMRGCSNDPQRLSDDSAAYVGLTKELETTIATLRSKREEWVMLQAIMKK